METKETAVVRVKHYDSPCGKIILAATAGGELCLCDWAGQPCAARNLRRLARHFHLETEVSAITSDTLDKAEKQLDEYFAGRRKNFDLPLRPIGTAFQKQVWDALLEIPYGETRPYMGIARRAGNAKGVRAVAQAIGANGLCLFIPCHRVIGSDGTLTGFAGGLAAKKFLLEMEKRTAATR